MKITGWCILENAILANFSGEASDEKNEHDGPFSIALAPAVLKWIQILFTIIFLRKNRSIFPYRLVITDTVLIYCPPTRLVAIHFLNNLCISNSSWNEIHSLLKYSHYKQFHQHSIFMFWVCSANGEQLKEERSLLG